MAHCDGRSCPMTTRALIGGCGDIGSRHLQAVAALPEISEIEVVDPRPEAIDVAKARLAEVPQGSKRSVRWLSRVEDARPDGAICIVATQAKDRVSLMAQLAESLSYQAFLVEKIVAQSTTEYEQLLNLQRQRGLSIWVNCKTRAYPFHLRAREYFPADEPIQFSVFGGNHGLASNGLHSVDLFVFYDRCDFLTPAHISVDDVLHESKRGGDVYDLSGTLVARSNKGSTMHLSFAPDHVAPPSYMVASSRFRFLLDQWDRLAFTSASTDWEWHAVDFSDDLLISTMSKQFVAQIVKESRCDLPTLSECRAAHTFLLDELLPHFRRLTGRPLDRCPVT